MCGAVLDFLAAFEGHNVAEFKLAPQGNATAVTWTMDGPRAFIAKVMSVFVNMDTMIGSDFESSLASLKRSPRNRPPAVRRPCGPLCAAHIIAA
jgi:hypothetical protein